MLQGKRAIVTGAANGIGKAIVARFLREGALVTFSDINKAKSEETLQELVETLGAKDRVQFVEADSSKEDHIARLATAAEGAFGSTDILVNNAAYFKFGTLYEIQREHWLRLFETNVLGYSDAIREVLPQFARRGGGVVVNIASVSSFIAQPDMFAYNAVKGGVAQLTRCLALDLAPQNVRVNAICPGAIFTPASENHMKFLGLTVEKGKKEFGDGCPMKRMGSPEEIAGPAAFLASSDASYMTGHLLVVDGGATID